MVTSITRGRSQEEGPEQPRIHSADNESSYLVTPQPTRKRNRNLCNTESATEHHSPGVNQEADATQTKVNPPKRRGQNINRSAMKALENLPHGTKISLTMDKDTKSFVGTSATQFATECGIVIRNVCPLNFHKWKSIPKDVKDHMYEKLQVRFNLLRTDKLFMEYVNTRLRNQWKRTRCDLSAH